jgi:hypothetical protein
LLLAALPARAEDLNLKLAALTPPDPLVAEHVNLRAMLEAGARADIQRLKLAQPAALDPRMGDHVARWTRRAALGCLAARRPRACAIPPSPQVDHTPPAIDAFVVCAFVGQTQRLRRLHARSSGSTTAIGVNPLPSPNRAARGSCHTDLLQSYGEKLSMSQLEDIARLLEQSPDFRVLRRLQPRDVFSQSQCEHRWSASSSIPKPPASSSTKPK